MTDGIKDLSMFHEVPYSNLRGAHVEIRIENTDHAAVGAVSNPGAHTTTEVREGVIVGRGNGRGVSYDTGENQVMETSIGPSVYLETPQDTILEVRADKSGNELLEFTPPEDADE